MKTELSKYSYLHGGCWSLYLLPCITFRKEYEYKRGSYGHGKPPDIHVFNIYFSWLFWHLEIQTIWDRKNAGDS